VSNAVLVNVSRDISVSVVTRQWAGLFVNVSRDISVSVVTRQWAGLLQSEVWFLVRGEVGTVLRSVRMVSVASSFSFLVVQHLEYDSDLLCFVPVLMHGASYFSAS
jgi:hypothetical protein